MISMKCDEAKHSFPWNPFIHEKVSCLKSAKGSIDDIFSALNSAASETPATFHPL